MVLASWVALLLGGVLAGLGPVASMVWRRRWEHLAVALTLLAAGLAATGLVGISILSDRVGEAVIAGFLGVAAAVGGFALGGALLAQPRGEPLPAALPDPLPDPAPGVAVLLLAEAEPASYEAGAVSRALRELADAGVELPPETMRPFIYASEKARYRQAGGSPERAGYRRAAEMLAARLEDARFAGVTLAWCDESPRLDEAVAFAASRGHREIVACVLSVADDPAIARARRRADALGAQQRGLTLRYAEPLWTCKALAERIAERIADAAEGAGPADVGVVLVGHGQPPEIEALDDTRTVHETVFHQRVRALLAERGFDETRVRLAWAEWLEPEVTEVVRHLAAVGCSRILVVPASMPAESLTTLLDIPEAVAQARVERTADVTVLPAWGEDGTVGEVLARTVREAAGEAPG